MIGGRRSTGLARSLREAWKNVRSTPLLTGIAVLNVAVSLILVGFFGVLLVNADRLLDGMARDLRVTVYLDREAEAEAIDTLQRRVARREIVRSTTFLTAEDDRERNVALLPPELLSGLEADDVPGQPALELRLAPREWTRSDLDRLTRWLDEVETVDAVQELAFGGEQLRVLFALRDLARVTGILICTIVLAAAVFFVFSTIRLAIHARREEIEILRLVGATKGFIRTPFYLEGALAGLAGSLVALGIVALLQARLVAFAEEAHLLNVTIDLMPAWMIVWLLAGGLALGLAGSVLSLERYLRA